MKTYDIFRFSLKSITRGRLRVFLTVLSIAIGVIAVVIISCVGSGGQAVVVGELKTMGISGLMVFPNESVSRISELKAEDAQTIARNVGNVALAMPFSTKYGMMRMKSTTYNTVIWGVGSEIQNFINCELLYGRYINDKDIKEGNHVVIIDNETAKSTYKRENVVGRELSVVYKGQTLQCTVIGVIRQSATLLQSMLAGQVPIFIYLPYTTLAQLTGSSDIDQIAIQCVKDTDTDKTSSSVISLLERTHEDSLGYSVQNLSSYMKQLDSIAGIITLILSATAAISLLVAGIGVMNTMLAAVKERRREVGICKAIGATRIQIALGFILEAGILSAVGGIVGMLIGIESAYIITKILSIDFIIRTDVILIAELVVVITGMFFGVYPAISASRLTPIVALREDW